ncbi:MAG: hypothetical protein WBM87_09715 [Woeseiaceae bacterium]
MAERALCGLFCWLAVCGAGAVAAAEKEEPEVDFLEYLGMWEESDEDWLILDETTIADSEERSDPAPDGDESTEKEDES